MTLNSFLEMKGPTRARCLRPIEIRLSPPTARGPDGAAVPWGDTAPVLRLSASVSSAETGSGAAEDGRWG